MATGSAIEASKDIFLRDYTSNGHKNFSTASFTSEQPSFLAQDGYFLTRLKGKLYRDGDPAWQDVNSTAIQVLNTLCDKQNSDGSWNDPNMDPDPRATGPCVWALSLGAKVLALDSTTAQRYKDATRSGTDWLVQFWDNWNAPIDDDYYTSPNQLGLTLMGLSEAYRWGYTSNNYNFPEKMQSYGDALTTLQNQNPANNGLWRNGSRNNRPDHQPNGTGDGYEVYMVYEMWTMQGDAIYAMNRDNLTPPSTPASQYWTDARECCAKIWDVRSTYGYYPKEMDQYGNPLECSTHANPSNPPRAYAEVAPISWGYYSAAFRQAVSDCGGTRKMCEQYHFHLGINGLSGGMYWEIDNLLIY